MKKGQPRIISERFAIVSNSQKSYRWHLKVMLRLLWILDKMISNIRKLTSFLTQEASFLSSLHRYLCVLNIFLFIVLIECGVSLTLCGCNGYLVHIIDKQKPLRFRCRWSNHHFNPRTSSAVLLYWRYLNWSFYNLKI